MLELSPKQSMTIFGELVQCYYNDHNYGGDTAEIYAYRLGRQSPIVHAAIGSDKPKGIPLERLEQFARECAESMLVIGKLFQETYNVKVLVNNKPIDEGIDPFVHRIHVTVVHDKN